MPCGGVTQAQSRPLKSGSGQRSFTAIGERCGSAAQGHTRCSFDHCLGRAKRQRQIHDLPFGCGIPSCRSTAFGKAGSMKPVGVPLRGEARTVKARRRNCLTSPFGTAGLRAYSDRGGRANSGSAILITYLKQRRTLFMIS